MFKYGIYEVSLDSHQCKQSFTYHSREWNDIKKNPMCMEMLPIETKTLQSNKAFIVGQSFVQKSNYIFLYLTWYIVQHYNGNILIYIEIFDNIPMYVVFFKGCDRHSHGLFLIADHKSGFASFLLMALVSVRADHTICNFDWHLKLTMASLCHFRLSVYRGYI